MPAVLKKISQLKPSVYQLKNSTDKKYYEGFIAQDVMKIFPGLVAHNTDEKRGFDTYMLDYDGFGVIAIKGIQELMKINKEKDDAIDSLKSEISDMRSEMSVIKTLLLKNNSNISSAAIANILPGEATLEQNIPNPFNHTTSISYALPKQFSSAYILVNDNNGKPIKRINVFGPGKGILHIDASALALGAYNYSLIVDGKMIDTRQMMTVK